MANNTETLTDRGEWFPVDRGLYDGPWVWPKWARSFGYLICRVRGHRRYVWQPLRNNTAVFCGRCRRHQYDVQILAG